MAIMMNPRDRLTIRSWTSLHKPRKSRRVEASKNPTSRHIERIKTCCRRYQYMQGGGFWWRQREVTRFLMERARAQCQCGQVNFWDLDVEKRWVFWGFCEWSRSGGRVDVRRRERDMVMSLDSGTESHTLPLFLFNVKIAALQVILIFFNVKKKLKTLLISF